MRWKKIGFCLLMLVSCWKIMVAQVEEIIDPIFISEEMPRFPGCENKAMEKGERQACANQKMLDFLYANIKLTVEHIQACGTYRYVVGVVVEKDGSLSNFEFLRGKNTAMQAEIIRVLALMSCWIPAQQNGQPIRKLFYLPVKIGPH